MPDGALILACGQENPTCSVSSALKAPEGMTSQVNREMMYPPLG
jgi:hypothetical protein